MKKILAQLCKLLPLAILLVGTFSYAQIPQPTPNNPYPWTQKAEYSSQSYDWEPLRYFGPKYSGYLNQEEPTVFIARSLTISEVDPKKPNVTDTVAQKLGIATSIYKTGVNRETKKALVAGSLRRNDAATVDLQLRVLNQKGDKTLWSSQVIEYVSSKQTVTEKKTDLLPFVFKEVEQVDDELKNKFIIVDSTTNQVLFGPMTFETLGDIERLEKPFDDSWYYIITDGISSALPAKKSILYKTKELCLGALPLDTKRTSTDQNCYQDGGYRNKYDILWFYYISLDPKEESDLYKNEADCKKAGKEVMGKDVICYTKHLKTIDVDLVTDNNFVVGNEVDKYSKITNTTAHLLFRVDTYGSPAKLGVYYIKYDDLKLNPPKEPTLVSIHDGVRSDFGKSIIMTADDITGLVKNTKYQIYVIDQSDLEGVMDSEGKPMVVSKVRKLFEGTIITKETNSFIKNTIPILSDKLTPDFDLKGVFDGEGGSNDLRIITCGYDGANIITTIKDASGNDKLESQPGPLDGKLLKPDPYFDANKDGKIDGDGKDINSEWKDKNDMEGFQPSGEICEFDDIIDIVRRLQKYVFTIVPLIAAVMFAYAGFLFLTGGANPAKITQAKDIMKYTLYGIVLVMVAWLLVANVFVLLGVDKSWSWLKM